MCNNIGFDTADGPAYGRSQLEIDTILLTNITYKIYDSKRQTRNELILITKKQTKQKMRLKIMKRINHKDNEKKHNSTKYSTLISIDNY